MTARLRAALRVGWLALPLVLTGCVAEQKHQLARCEDEAQETFRQANLETPEIAEHIRLCMHDAGYEPRQRPECADPAGQSTNPYCYQPAALFERWIFQVEAALGG